MVRNSHAQGFVVPFLSVFSGNQGVATRYIPNTQFNIHKTCFRPLKITVLQAAYNYNYSQGFLNSFNVGGTGDFLENQIVFKGLKEYDILTKSVAAASTGWRTEIGNDFFVTLSGSAAIYDVDLENYQNLSLNNLVIGGDISIGYLSVIGPIDISFAYSPQPSRIIGYLNLGWMF